MLLVGLSPCYWRGEERILQANHKRWGVQAGDDDMVVQIGEKFVKIDDKLVKICEERILQTNQKEEEWRW